MIAIFVAAMAAPLGEAPASAPPAPSPPAVVRTLDQVEVTARAPVIGDLKQGVLNYRSEFFTQVRPATALDMIQWLPGFSFQDTRDMRGLGVCAGSNVLIDGKPPDQQDRHSA